MDAKGEEKEMMASTDTRKTNLHPPSTNTDHISAIMKKSSS